MKQINILFISSIGNFLNVDAPIYQVKNINNEFYFIEENLLLFHGRIKDIFDTLGYDYDLLPNNLKDKFKDYYKSFSLVNDNIYSLDSKKILRKK